MSQSEHINRFNVTIRGSDNTFLTSALYSAEVAVPLRAAKGDILQIESLVGSHSYAPICLVPTDARLSVKVAGIWTTVAVDWQPSGGDTGIIVVDGRSFFTNYDGILKRINETLWAALILATGNDPTGTCGFFVDGNKIRYNLPDPADAVVDTIAVNYDLLRFFAGFSIIPRLSNTNREFEIVMNMEPGPVPSSTYIQPISLFSSWFDIVGLRIKTQMIGLEKETLVTNSPLANTASILTEFKYPFPEGSMQGAKGQVYYTPEISRQIIVTNGPISGIDLAITLVLRDGTDIPYILLPDDYLQLKIAIVHS